MPERYGASEEAWLHYMSLGLTADLLPVVSNPAAPISPNSTMRALGKTPSRYNHNRQAVGIAEWTKLKPSAQDVERWAKEPDFGIAIQTRRLRAIDIDVTDRGKAEVLVERVQAHLGETLQRYRMDSGKVLIPFWHDEPLPKHVVPVDGGMIEILGDGQQFIAEGTHPEGKRYRWTGEGLPTLDSVDFALLLASLREIATGEIRIARQRRELNGSGRLVTHDPVADWLLDNWEIYDVGNESQIFLACPFAEEHSSDSGPTATAYFPAGSGGYSEGSFVCLHAHCLGRGQAEFLNATGFTASAFGVLGDAAGASSGELNSTADGSGTDREAERTGETAPSNKMVGRTERQALIQVERWPKLTRDSAARIEGTMDNLLNALRCPQMTKMQLSLDRFREELVWSPHDVVQAEWQAFKDSDYARLRQQLEIRGFKPFGAEMLRLAVLTVAEDQAMDTAQEWLSRLHWDGSPRVEGFAARAWGWEADAYAAAVSRYLWTALAGRIVQPGVQADMAPVLIGGQGIRKTTAVKTMAPSPQTYLSIKLDAHDDDSSRKLRGKLVVELEELRGLRTKAMEEIKAWITKTDEEWVPKFREFSTTFPRRSVFVATINDDEFLDDPTGERRWLPGRCGTIDVDWIRANRDQLWAEGAALFAVDGVDWEDAERLAKEQHDAFKIADAWEPYVRAWLFDEQISGRPVDWPCVTAADALTGAINLPLSQVGHGQKLRMAKILRALGLKECKKRVNGEKVNGWVWEG